MPPPSPYNLNRWVVIGTFAMIVSGYFAAKRSKPAFEFEKATPDAVDAGGPTSQLDSATVAPSSADSLGTDGGVWLPSDGKVTDAGCPPGVPNCH